MFASDHRQSFFKKWTVFFLKKCLFLFILFFLYSSIVNQEWDQYFPIQNVSVFGVPESYSSEVKKAVLPFLNEGFFAVQIDAIKDHLSELPWVSSVVIKKVWPERLEIWLEEKKAIAVWNEHHLLTEHGELFKTNLNHVSKNLPKLVGTHGNHVKILRQYNLFKEQMIKIKQNVVYVEETPFADWKVKLENGIVLFISDDQMSSRLARFLDVYASLVDDRAEAVDYIDLRYANGVAVRWKNGLNLT